MTTACPGERVKSKTVRQTKEEKIMSHTNTRASRRNFLLAVSAGGAATVAGIAAMAIRPGAKKSAAADQKVRGKGYQESAHVRSYYNSTKV